MIENNSDEIFIQLLKNISTIKGYILTKINTIQNKLRRPNRRIRLVNTKEIVLYTSDINYTYDTCQSTNQLLLLNKEKFCHIETFSTINCLFSQFFSHLKVFK